MMDTVIILLVCGVICAELQVTMSMTPVAEDINHENKETYPMPFYLTRETTGSSTSAKTHNSAFSPNGTTERYMTTERAMPDSSLITCDEAGFFKELFSNCSLKLGDIERICGCDSTCLVLNNCCCDSAFVNVDMPTKTTAECVKGITRRIAPSSPVYLITKCPADWENDELRRYCEDPSDEQLIHNVPCYSPDTGLSYVNSFCSLCHNVSECIEWELVFQCNNPWMPFDVINTLDNMKAIIDERPFSRRGCQFTVLPRFEQPIAYCEPSAIDFCPLFTPEDLSKKCHMYFNPVKINFKFYRNIHCFYCNNYVPVEEISIQFYVKKTLIPLSILLDLQQVEQREAVNTEPIILSPVINKVTGFCQLELVYVQITGTNMTEIDVNLLLEIDIACIGYIKYTLASDLRTFYPETRVHGTGEISKQMRSFQVSVKITEELLLHEIDEISDAIRAVSFSFQFNDMFNITCCFYHNGTPRNFKSNAPVGTKPQLIKRSDSPARTSTSSAISTQFPICLVFLYHVIDLQ